MPPKIIITKESVNEILSLYLSGIGSTTISKNLGINKRSVLKVLNDNNLIIKKENLIYNTFKLVGDKWITTYVCQQCKNKIEISASTPYYLARNLKKKRICKQCSLLKQHGGGNPFYGKKHKKETIIGMSNSRKGKGIGENNGMSKPENRELLSKIKLDLWNSGKMEGVRIKMSKLMTQRIANGELKSYNRSKAEDELIDFLSFKNIECEPNFKIFSKIYDLYIPKLNLIIEYNGDYWHCNPIKYNKDYFHTKKNKTAKEIWVYDENKLDLAKTNGYNIEIIWESDYKRDKNIINQIIEKYGGKIR